ncbi:MAG: creatinine amidohydrolase [Thermoleophilaceae bacterium]|nr:creatinine amidohydrolase [Thermoleophilaceae bacterium]
MTQVVDAGRLTREAANAVAADSLLVIPLGTTEQHGPHLPASTDAVIVTAIAERAASLARRPEVVVVAPTVPVGASDHHLPFGATLSLSAATASAVMADLVRSALRSRFTTVVLLNGHGGNDTAMRSAIDTTESGEDAVIVGCSYWECIDASELPHVPGRFPGHAGVFETSVMLALAPHLVDIDAARPSPGEPPRDVPGARVAAAGAWGAMDGFTDDPTQATRELGDAALAACAAGVARVLDDAWQLRRRAREA